MTRERLIVIFPYVICFLFFLAYSILSVVRFLNFGAFGFDLGIADQIVWKYSQLKSPITTIQFFPFTSLLTDHVELIYILLAPFYWIYNSPITLLLLQTFLISLSGLPVYWLARKKGIKLSLSFSILFVYLSFYGIQNAIWFDVHSSVFGIAFIPWYIYLVTEKKYKSAFLFFLLAIISKENIALITLLISFVFIIIERKKIHLLFILLSCIYLFSIFFIYFPYFTQDGYRYQNSVGLFADTNPYYLLDTAEKRNVYFYSFAHFGFLPILSPIYLIPALGDIFHYFVLGNNIAGAHGLFMHYRASLAILLVWPLIITLNKFKRLNNKYTALYLIIVAAIVQYSLHLPLTYLTKSWFWSKPPSVSDINTVISIIPKNSSIVAQNNIVPHLSHRDEIFTLWPAKRKADINVKCDSHECQWFRWAGQPKLLIVDTSTSWDIRHLLTNREEFIKGINNLESNKYIEKKIESGSVVLYEVKKSPDK